MHVYQIDSIWKQISVTLTEFEAVKYMAGIESPFCFVKQGDHLRQQALQQMYKILTIRQAARGLVVLGDYFQRLRALSSLWAARPREPS